MVVDAGEFEVPLCIYTWAKAFLQVVVAVWLPYAVSFIARVKYEACD